jgi:hypothetical protein
MNYTDMSKTTLLPGRKLIRLLQWTGQCGKGIQRAFQQLLSLETIRQTDIKSSLTGKFTVF